MMKRGRAGGPERNGEDVSPADGQDGGRRPLRIPVPDNVEILVETFGQFLAQHAQDISEGGMFLRSAAPAPPGARIVFAIRLADGYTLVRGVGEVMWTREPGEDPSKPPGMGIRFVELEEEGRQLIRKLVDERRRQRSQPHERTVPLPVQSPQPVEPPDAAVPPPSKPAEPFGEPPPPPPTVVVTSDQEPFPEVAEAPEPEGPAERPDVSEDAVFPVPPTQAPPLEEDLPPVFSASPQGQATNDAPTSKPAEAPPPEGPVEMPEPGAVPGTEFTVVYGERENEIHEPLPPARGRGFWLFAIPVALLALAALAYGAWRLGYLPVTLPKADGTARVAQGTPPPTTAPPQTTLPAQGTAASPVSQPTAPARQDHPGTPERTPAARALSATATPVPVTPTAVPRAHPAARIRSIRATARGNGTRVLIVGDGPIDPSRTRIVMLEDPPRALLKIRGIRHPYEPTVIEAGTPGLARIRVWLHQELRPPQLYVVLDLTRPDVHVGLLHRKDGLAVTVE